MTTRIVRPVALYARVSTRDKEQDPELQLVPMREFAAARGWQTVEYTDFAPAGDLRARASWRRLLADADRHKVSLILTWKLDRGFRSTLDALSTLQRLEHAGVGFSAITQPELDATSAGGRLVFTILAAVAEMERALIGERVKEGMRHAAAKGIKIGRRSVADDPAFLARWLVTRAAIAAGDLSQRQAAKRLGVGQATVRRLLNAA